MRTKGRQEDRAAIAHLEPTVTDRGVAIGVFEGFDAGGGFLVGTDDAPAPMVAVSIVRMTLADVGARVVISHEGGDVTRPVILGRVQEPRGGTARVKADRERLVIQADREIELRCGDASIVLTRAGKVLIRGSYVLSRSRGANRIKGAFVDIN